MGQRRKRLSQQVIVITGASSGIGLVTARRAAACGAKVVLAARNGGDLERAVEAIRAAGGKAIAVTADTSDRAQVEHLGRTAHDTFGRIDTWINNAAVSMYGRVEQIPLEDARRLFDVNFWGYVHGCVVALQHMRAGGGGIVNVTSALADRAIPLQAYYCAAKHALKAFTDSLRMEIEQQKLPVTVSQVKPGSIDTPFFEKARNYFDREAQAVPPVYAPEIVADVILDVCVRPRRDVVVTGMGKLLSSSNRISPRLTDLYLEKRGMESAQLSDIPKRPDRPDNLWAPVAEDGGERGATWKGRTKETSVYNTIDRHGRALVGAVATGVASVALGAAALRALARPGTRRLPPETITRMSSREAYVDATRELDRQTDRARGDDEVDLDEGAIVPT